MLQNDHDQTIFQIAGIIGRPKISGIKFANESARLHNTKMPSTCKHKLSSSSCGPRPSQTWSIHKICENYAMYSSLRCTVVILTSGIVKEQQ